MVFKFYAILELLLTCQYNVKKMAAAVHIQWQ